MLSEVVWTTTPVMACVRGGVWPLLELPPVALPHPARTAAASAARTM
jgi:hypothetical protein